MEIDITFCILCCYEALTDHDISSVEKPPWFPAVVAIAKHGRRGPYPYDIDPQCRQQIIVHKTEELEGFVDPNWNIIEVKCSPQAS
jgi:hypothetical protein